MRAIYEVKLQESLFPGLNESDAAEMQEAQECDLTTRKLVDEEQTMKLFTLARQMYTSEKFEYADIRHVIVTLADSWGYKQESEEIAETVTKWCERLEDYDEEEWTEWLTREK